MITYRPLDREYMENVKELYAALGWTAYLGDDPRLYRAWEASLYALGAFEGDRLIGFIQSLFLWCSGQRKMPKGFEGVCCRSGGVQDGT